MPVVPLPINEQARLAALYRYGILDTAAEQNFDDLTALAAFICEMPIALISLIDADRQWVKSRVGLAIEQIPRSHAFCAQAISDSPQVVVVNDASLDSRFADNPLVTAHPGIRFYAGAPLVSRNGEVIGTICVMDVVPRVLVKQKIDLLAVLSRQVMASIELRRISEISRDEGELLKDVQHIGRIGSWYWEAKSSAITWSDEHFHIFDLEPDKGVPQYPDYLKLYTDESGEWLDAALKICAQTGEKFEIDLERACTDGIRQWMAVCCKARYGSKGELKGVGGTTRDISERKLAEEVLSKNAASERAILDNLPYMVWLKDTEGRYVNVNQKYVQNSGLMHAAQIIGKTDFDLWPQELAEKYYADDIEVMAMRRQIITEDPALQGDRMYWTETIKTPIVDHQGNLLGTTGFARDITQKKQAEKILLDSRDYLKEMVDKATLELKQLQENYEEASTTLKVVLKHKEIDKSEAQEALTQKVRQEVAPFLKKLKASARQPRQTRLLDALDANLQQLVNSFGQVSPVYFLLYQQLTPIEIQVASLVREGVSTKVIAETLTLSPETISVHRKHIRRKLGLTSKSANLQSYLLSLNAKSG
jgi:PAS domain S-box-containing protein